ncbi:MAG: hypothetical protein R3B47_10440 [Bacteroidia bacterium]
MKRILSIFAVAISIAAIVTSCATTDIKLSKKLDGKWSATSIKVDGVEFMPEFIVAWDMTFTDQGDGMGTVENISTYKFEFLGQVITETDTAIGTYQTVADDNGDKLTLTLDGDVTAGDLSIDGKTMTVTSTEDSVTTVIVAEKQ